MALYQCCRHREKLFAPVSRTEVGAVELAGLQEQLLENAWAIVLVDGHFSAALSNIEGLPVGTVVMDMATAIEQQADVLQSYFSQAVQDTEHGFVAFNNAWFSDGVFIHVPANEVLAKPIQIIHVVTQADYMANTRHIIALGTSAQATVVETFVGCDDSYCSASVTEIFVGKMQI